MAKDINRCIPVTRQDHAPRKRIELHLHTKMSALDGVVDVQDQSKRQLILAIPRLPLLIMGVVQAFPEAYEAGKKYG